MTESTMDERTSVRDPFNLHGDEGPDISVEDVKMAVANTRRNQPTAAARPATQQTRQSESRRVGAEQQINPFDMP